jgi:hypothetical protein
MTQDVGAIKIVPKIGTITSIDANKGESNGYKINQPYY